VANNPTIAASISLRCKACPSWIRRSKIIVEVLNDELLVTMPGTSFSVLYARTKNDQLIVSFFWKESSGRKSMVSFPHFLSLA
jgi:hypothetical protein